MQQVSRKGAKEKAKNAKVSRSGRSGATTQRLIEGQAVISNL
jgi:hypothetical protein